jgi:hypothetical protein
MSSNCNLPPTVCPLNKLDARTFEQFRGDVFLHFDAVTEKLEIVAVAMSEQRTLMRTLTGNGDPGRIGKLERSVEWLKKVSWLFVGIGALLAWIGFEGVQYMLAVHK